MVTFTQGLDIDVKMFFSKCNSLSSVINDAIWEAVLDKVNILLKPLLSNTRIIARSRDLDYRLLYYNGTSKRFFQ